jgi:nicotinate dehydrogenase subunit B
MQDSGTAIRHAAAQVRALLPAWRPQRSAARRRSAGARDGAVDAAAARVELRRTGGGRELHVRPAGPACATRRATHASSASRCRASTSRPRSPAAPPTCRTCACRHGAWPRRAAAEPGGARCSTLDSGAVEKMPGVLKVVRDGRFLAVIASGIPGRHRGARAGRRAARWQREAAAARPGPPPVRDIAASLPPRRPRDPRPGKAPARRRRRPARAYPGPTSCTRRSARPARWRSWTDGKLHRVDPFAGRVPAARALAELLACRPRTSAASTSKARAATATTAPTTWPPMPRCWRAPCPASRCACSGCARTSTWLGAVRPADGDRRAGHARRDGRIATGSTRSGATRTTQRPGKAGRPALRHAPGASPSCPAAQADPQPEGGGDRNAIPLYNLPNARSRTTSCRHAAARVGAALAGRLHERVLDRELHGRTGARRRRRPGGVPPASTWPIRARRTWSTWPRSASAGTRYAPRGRRGRGFAFARYKNLAPMRAGAARSRCARHRRSAHRARGGGRRLRRGRQPRRHAQPDRGRHRAVVQLDAVRGSAFDSAAHPSRDWGGYPILRFPGAAKASRCTSSTARRSPSSAPAKRRRARRRPRWPTRWPTPPGVRLRAGGAPARSRRCRAGRCRG